MPEEPRLQPYVTEISTKCSACGDPITARCWCLRGVVDGKTVVLHDNGGVCLQKLRARLHLPMTPHQKFLSSRTVV